MTDETWIPVAFNLGLGNPFAYSTRSISAISATEAFRTRIDVRDDEKCVVCGEDSPSVLEHCHIVPLVEPHTWEYMRNRGFIPRPAKSVVHEARNGILMCKNHHAKFEAHEFYIRWVPEVKRFVLINQSRRRGMELFHGRAVRLFPDDPCVPFHGAFLNQEMRARGRWPYFESDRPIQLPVPWQMWMQDDGGGGGGYDNESENDDHSDGDDGDKDALIIGDSSKHNRFLEYPRSNMTTKNMLLLTNPFDKPDELKALKHSFTEQPNWKAAVVEGESWEGTAKENVIKWQGLVGIAENDE